MKRVVISILLIIYLISTSCEAFDSFIVKQEKYGFKTKEEVIYAVKDNIRNLDKFLNEIDKIESDKEYFTIEKNDEHKMYKDSFVLNSDYINDLFEKLKIGVCYIDKSDGTISFEVNFYTFSNYCGFYYSHNDNPMYDETNRNIEYPCIQYGKWTLMFGSRYGWYTEKIFDNWYYYEQYEGARNVIKYIEDDLKNMGYYDRIIKEIEEYEQKRDGYRK